MGIMEIFRASTKYVLWLLIISFGVLFMLADTQLFDAIMSGPRSLGEVNGEPISFEAYNNRIQYYSERYREQSGDSPNDELRSYYEETAWKDLVTASIVQQKMKELGITVTDEELREMILGEEPDPFIKQQFTDSLGNFQRDALLNAIEAKENTQIWIQVENQLREQRRQQKLNTYLESGILVGKKEIEEAFIKQNSLASVSFVRFPMSEIADSLVTATDAELKTWYKNNSARFQQKKSWRFSYVSFDTTPTAEDTAIVVKELEELKSRFATTSDDSLFMVQNQSETQYSRAFIAKNDVKEAFKPLFSLNKGEVSNPVVDGGQVHLLKLIDVKGTGEKAEYRFADLSIIVNADPNGTLRRADEAAQDFIYFAGETSFAEQAAAMNLAPQSGFVSEGNPFVAGLGQSRQILSFLERASEGKVSDPFELQNKLVVVKLEEEIPAGSRKFEDVKPQVERFVKNEKRKTMMKDRVNGLLASSTTLETLAPASNKVVTPASNIRLDAQVIPGAGRENGFIGKIFSLEPGADIHVFAGETAVFVFRVDSKQMADITTMTAVQHDEIEKQLKQNISNLFNRTWVDQLVAEADVRDYRRIMLQN